MPNQGRPFHNKINYDSILLSLLLAVFGAALAIWPQTSTQMIFTILGAVLCLFGVFRLLNYFLRDCYDAMLRQDMTIGLLTILLGILMIVKHESLVALLPMIFGCVLLVGGISKLQSTLDFKRMGIKIWYIPLVAAIICIILGIVIMRNSMAAMDFFVRMAGIALALEGIANLITTISVYWFRSRMNRPPMP